MDQKDVSSKKSVYVLYGLVVLVVILAGGLVYQQSVVNRYMTDLNHAQNQLKEAQGNLDSTQVQLSEKTIQFDDSMTQLNQTTARLQAEKDMLAEYDSYILSNNHDNSEVNRVSDALVSLNVTSDYTTCKEYGSSVREVASLNREAGQTTLTFFNKIATYKNKTACINYVETYSKKMDLYAQTTLEAADTIDSWCYGYYKAFEATDEWNEKYSAPVGPAFNQAQTTLQAVLDAYDDLIKTCLS